MYIHQPEAKLKMSQSKINYWLLQKKTKQTTKLNQWIIDIIYEI
jgi:hypothetical protein